MTEELRKKVEDEFQNWYNKQTTLSVQIAWMAGAGFMHSELSSRIEELERALRNLSNAAESYDEEDGRCMERYGSALMRASELLKKHGK